QQAIKKYGSYTKAAKWVAPPEYSHHPLGLAIDVNYPNDQKSAKWLELNGYKFGLCRIFKNEWWHFDFKDWEKYDIYDIPFSKIGK
ncbi:MAG: D-alanyl-D-alanine carboxypeptidase family protein, partial [bacterium]